MSERNSVDSTYYQRNRDVILNREICLKKKTKTRRISKKLSGG